MYRRTFLATAGLVGSATLAGCLDSTSEEPRRIAVDGSAEVLAEPDRANLEIAVMAVADTAGAVRDDLTERGETLREALIASGIDEAAIETAAFRIDLVDDETAIERNVEQGDPIETPDRHTYYRGTHQYRVQTDDIDEVGEIIDAAIDGGADEVSRIEYTLRDETREQHREQALEDAIAAARADADIAARKTDVTIVDVDDIDATSGLRPVRHHDVVEDAQAVPETTIDPGEVTVSAQVDVRYRIQ